MRTELCFHKYLRCWNLYVIKGKDHYLIDKFFVSKPTQRQLRKYKQRVALYAK